MKTIIKNLIKGIFWRIRYRRCRRCTELNLSGTVLILAPHPDDEALGCGGLIARLCAEGNPPHVVIMTGGGGSLRGHSDMPESEVAEARRKLTLASAHELGLPEDHIHFLDFIDGSIANRPKKEIQRLRELIAHLNPSAILVPHHGEGWPDHLVVQEIGSKLAPKDVKVYEYCVWMWYYRHHSLDWRNARCLRMTSNEHTRKLTSIHTYTSACAPCGKPWVGILPKIFVKANSTDTELFFRIK